MNYTEFLESKVFLPKQRYEISQMNPADLLNKEVVSIRGGFSSIYGGQIMVVESIHKMYIDLKSINPKSKTKWACEIKTMPDSIILYTEEIKEMMDKDFKLFRGDWWLNR